VRRDQVLPEMNVAGPRSAFFERLNKHQVKIETNIRLDEIVEDGIIVTNQEGRKTKIKGDTVVLALGLKSDSQLYDEIRSLPDIAVYSIGDYAEPRNIYDALHEGHLTARNL